MSLTILGLGTAVPPYPMSQAEAVDLARQVCCETDQQVALLRTLYRKSGVGMRYTVLPYQEGINWARRDRESREGLDGREGLEGREDIAVGTCVGSGPSTRERMQYYAEYALPLAAEASREALERAGVAPDAITHIVTVSCTGFAAPGVDVGLMGELGLRPTTERTHVGFMGCHGAINGMRVARGLAGGNAKTRVLLCAVEVCSVHYRLEWDPRWFVGNAIFADGAAAVVCSAGEPANDAWRLTATGSCLLPDSADCMSWHIGDHGFEMHLSPRVPELISRHLQAWLEEWLSAQGRCLADVRTWAIHPGGPRILSAVEKALALDETQTQVSRDVLAQFGNMSSPTVLFILDRLRRRDCPRPCLALGFGPGLVAEAALFE